MQSPKKSHAISQKMSEIHGWSMPWGPHRLSQALMDATHSGPVPVVRRASPACPKRVSEAHDQDGVMCVDSVSTVQKEAGQSVSKSEQAKSLISSESMRKCVEQVRSTSANEFT